MLIRAMFFGLIAFSASHSSADVIKCKDRDNRVTYHSRIDAIKLSERSDIACSGLENKVDKNKKSNKSYQSFLREKSTIRGINAVKLSDLHQYINDNISTESIADLKAWVNSFPPFTEGVAIQYPTAVSNVESYRIVETKAPSCKSYDYDGMVLEEKEYHDTYLGETAYGATARVREETTIKYCLLDSSMHRATFTLTDYKNIKKSSLVVIGKGKINTSIKDKYSSRTPKIHAPLDSTRVEHRFVIDADEYLLVNKDTGKVLDRKPAKP